jgi:hypothetical protein
VTQTDWKSGIFKPVFVTWGKKREIYIRAPDMEKHVSHMAIWKVLHEQLLQPYHLQRVQRLMPADFIARNNFAGVVFNEVFSIYFLHQCSLQRRKIWLETPSSIFTINKWTEENPFETPAFKCGEALLVTVCCVGL